MSHWERVKICDFAQVITGGTPSTKIKEYWDNGTIPWLQSGACQNKIIDSCNTFITTNGLSNSAAKMMMKDSVLIALTGATTGKVGLLKIEACANQSVTGIQPNDLFDSKYLFYYLISIRQKILNDSYGGAQKHISQAYVKNISVPLPPLEEQRRIAETLDLASSLIGKRKKQIGLLDTLAKSLFIEMFGDPVENPMGWEVRKVSQVCTKIVGGGTPSKSHPEYYTGNIPWVTPKDMKSLLIDDSIDHITQEAVNNSSTTLIPAQSILMVIRSGILKHTLPVALNTCEVALNQDMKAFMTNETVNQWYLLFFFKAIGSKLLTQVRGVTADNIEFNLIKNHEIQIPPIELQNEFAERIESIEARKSDLQKGLEKLEMNYKALMQMYFEDA